MLDFKSTRFTKSKTNPLGLPAEVELGVVGEQPTAKAKAPIPRRETELGIGHLNLPRAHYIRWNGVLHAIAPYSTVLQKHSIVMDVKITGGGSDGKDAFTHYTALYTTRTTVSAHADGYIHKDGRIGKGSYGGKIPYNQWIRMAITNDGHNLIWYCDGKRQHSISTHSNNYRTVGPSLLLFCSNDPLDMPGVCVRVSARS